YLQFSVMLAAGLDGIKKKIMPPEPVEKDIYHLTEKERKELGIENLPGSLGEALEIFRNSELMKETLGEHIFNHFYIVKKKEVDIYRAEVTEWEIKNLLPIL
ncbi:MAG: glutamine synthetase, partial [Thermoplasmata archaeon]